MTNTVRGRGLWHNGQVLVLFGPRAGCRPVTLFAWGLLSGAAVLAIGAQAHAQTGQEIATRRELLESAATAREHGHHAEALDLYIRAGQIEMTPSVQAFIADEQMEVGQLAEALGAADLCVRDIDRDPSVHNREVIRAHCLSLQNDLRPRVGRLVVEMPTPTPPELHITVAGRVLNPALYNVASVVTPGDVPVVAIVGHGDSAQTVTVTTHVAAGATATAHVILPTPVSTHPPPEAVPVTTTPTVPVAVPATVVPAPPVTPTPVPIAEAHEGGGTVRALAWTSGIVAFGALVGGAVALGYQHSYASDFNGPSGTGQYRVSDCLVAGSGCATTQGQANTAQSLAWVGFITGAVLAGVSTTLFMLSPSDSHTTHTAFACGDGPGLVGVSCTTTF